MILQLDGVTKEYPHPAGRVTVLKGVNLALEKGQTAAILGPSGSGKSTLLALLAGLDQPTAGSLKVMDLQLAGLAEDELTRFRAEGLGIVFQQFHLMSHLTAAENIALPLKILQRDGASQLAQEALAAVGLDKRWDHYPHELSGGECQRVAIARALIARPPLILADEPSGNLDAETGEQVMTLLFDLVKGSDSTLVLVTHNRALAGWCQRQFELREGRLEERL